jgi:hypothetical protein
MADEPRHDLDTALKQLERVAANLQKAEKVWAELVDAALTSDEHESRVRIFCDLIAALPPIDGFRVESVPMSKTEMQLARFGAAEVDEPEFHVHTEQQIAAPGTELREYRHRFQGARREIVRGRMTEVIAAVEDLIVAMAERRAGGEHRSTDQWNSLDGHIAELDRLLGDSTSRPARWRDLRRHLAFGEEVDLNDILDTDWPSVKAELDKFMYDEFEPLPVELEDIGALVTTRPAGQVTTALDWSRLDADAFERLLFELVCNEAGYENGNWLMKTAAADQGRDVETYRVTVDGLSGTRRERVIVQCKHWRSRSVGRDEVALCAEVVRLWEPPRVDVLVVATSGRFSRDAVSWRERRDMDGTLPRVEYWPDSHLEMLLARRPYLIATFGLR